MTYNALNALYYEASLFLLKFFPWLAKNPWIKKLQEYCREDWAEFRTEAAMEKLDEQIEAIHSAWDGEFNQYQAVFIEEEPDGSEAQKLLGGPMRITSSWNDDKL